MSDALDEDAGQIDTAAHLDEVIALDDLEDSDDEVNAAVWFVSLLTRVDGSVLMRGDLSVEGFGVEITEAPPPAEVYRALNHTGTRRKRVDYNHFGTRHRSMMRYCAAVPGSVGFVISQDGAVRAMMASDDGVLMWDDVLVQRPADLPARPPMRR